MVSRALRASRATLVVKAAVNFLLVRVRVSKVSFYCLAVLFFYTATPVRVQETLKTLLDDEPEVLEITEPALQLSEQYLKRDILTQKFCDDALHIALASLANVDVLVSWNFRHIVHYDKIRLFNAVNIENSLKSIDNYSPREVTNYEE